MIKENKIIVQVAHITKTPGPVQFLARFLSDKTEEFYKIYHPLDLKEEIDSIFSKGDKVIEQKKSTGYFSHFFRTIKWLKKIKEPVQLAVGMNCFDVLPLILLRKKLKVKKIVFFTTDFSRKRFDSFWSNKLYIFIDKFCAKKADFVCCNTRRAINRRVEEGVSENKIIYTPNGVFLKDIRTFDANKTFSKKLLYVGRLSEEHGLENIIEFLIKSELTLEIIGSGDREKKLKEKISKSGLTERVKFLGIKEHNEVIEYLKNFSGFGIAPYKIKSDWVWYCDPVKIKEYLACLVPVIISDVPEIAETIKCQNLGFVYNNADKLKNILKKISKMNQSEYVGFLERIKNLNKADYDLEKIYEKIYILSK